MKIKELIEKLRDLDPELVIVIQKQSGPEYYTHHLPILQVQGHPGHDGPVLHLGNAHMGLAIASLRDDL